MKFFYLCGVNLPIMNKRFEIEFLIKKRSKVPEQEIQKAVQIRIKYFEYKQLSKINKDENSHI